MYGKIELDGKISASFGALESLYVFTLDVERSEVKLALLCYMEMLSRHNQAEVKYRNPTVAVSLHQTTTSVKGIKDRKTSLGISRGNWA